MRIVLYSNRNVGLIALSHLVSLGYMVDVITDGDKDVEWLAERLGCSVIGLNEYWGKFDLFICVHGRKIIPKSKLADNKFVNIHPCLFKYKGVNPIKKYMKNLDTKGSVESHWMEEKPDEGEVIHQEFFKTPLCINYSDFYNVALKHYYFCLDATLNKIINA